VKQCLEYRDRLRAIEPNVDYVMSLYLHEDITPEVIREAKKAGITGVKSYPAGVTTVRTNPDTHPQRYAKAKEDKRERDWQLMFQAN